MSPRPTQLLAATLALLTFPAPLGAQRVWPGVYANSPGEAAQETPFTVNSLSTPRGSRNATLIEGSTLPFRPGSVLDAIAFRRDSSFQSETYPARTGRFELRIGPIHDALEPTAGLRDMWSDSPSRAAFGELSLPTAPPPGAGPAPFDLRVPFDLPFVWTGGDLGIDLVFTSSSDAPWRRDATWRRPLVDGRTAVFGAGCPTSDGLVPQAWIDADSAHPGGALVTRLQHAPLPVGLPALLYYGSRRSTPLALSAIGMPSSCYLHLDPVVHLATLTEAPSTLQATAAVSVPLPSNPGLVGAGLDAQWLVADPALPNTTPVVASDALAITLGAPAASAAGLGRSFWGRGVQLVGIEYTGRLGPIDHVPILRFEGTFQ